MTSPLDIDGIERAAAREMLWAAPWPPVSIARLIGASLSSNSNYLIFALGA
jgi:hypothetical protein